VAMISELRFRSRRQCLEAFARTLGTHPPRQPLPEWWPAFEKWYQDVRARQDLLDPDDPNYTALAVRTEAFTHKEED
jgi:hypothetical protein